MADILAQRVQCLKINKDYVKETLLNYLESHQPMPRTCPYALEGSTPPTSRNYELLRDHIWATMNLYRLNIYARSVDNTYMLNIGDWTGGLYKHALRMS